MLQLCTSKWLLCACLLLLPFLAINGKEWMLERVDLLKINPKYMKNTTCEIVTNARRKRVINFYTETLQTLDNNVTVNFLYEEFIRNEYKSVFIGFRFKFCEFLESPYLMIKQKYGIGCPLKPKIYKLYNVSVQWDLVPKLFPYKKGRVVSTFSLAETKEVIGSAMLYTHL